MPHKMQVPFGNLNDVSAAPPDRISHTRASLTACVFASAPCQSPTLGHQKSQKIFVEIGPAFVLGSLLKCPLGVFAVEDVQPPPRTRVAHEHQYG
jgi:hypothetical protein